MNPVTQQIENILANSTEAMWMNSRGEGVEVGIPVRKKDGTPFSVSAIYKRVNGEFVFLRIAEKQ